MACVFMWLTGSLHAVKSDGQFRCRLPWPQCSTCDVDNLSFCFQHPSLCFLCVFLLACLDPSPLFLLSDWPQGESSSLGWHWAWLSSGFYCLPRWSDKVFGLWMPSNANDLRFLFPPLTFLPSFRLKFSCPPDNTAICIAEASFLICCPQKSLSPL